jgi:hypothetical protein
MSTTTNPAGAMAPLVSVGTMRQILQRVDRAVHIGERELRYQLASKQDHPLAQSGELLFVLAELEELGLIEAELCFRLTDHGRQHLTQPDEREQGERFAVMQDDTVLCAECVGEISEQSATADTLVHAWVDPSPGTCCRWCGTTAHLDADGREVGS